ncbi:unnamed protein product [Trichogramma brassicae]|uniref:Uncharacterized protein n=1 Tax=Trichogramma brassicae TaxID=86971 RepID=A0A6H5IX21_9HYME|nr:unnamed protein product [Trichogramma brassicae]
MYAPGHSYRHTRTHPQGQCSIIPDRHTKPNATISSLHFISCTKMLAYANMGFMWKLISFTCVCMCSLYVLRAPLPPCARVAFYERGERHAQVRDRERREIESKGLLKVAAAAAAHGAISPSATATAPIHYTYIGILAHAQMHTRARPGRARGLGVTRYNRVSVILVSLVDFYVQIFSALLRIPCRVDAAVGFFSKFETFSGSSPTLTVSDLIIASIAAGLQVAYYTVHTYIQPILSRTGGGSGPSLQPPPLHAHAIARRDPVTLRSAPARRRRLASLFSGTFAARASTLCLVCACLHMHISDPREVLPAFHISFSSSLHSRNDASFSTEFLYKALMRTELFPAHFSTVFLALLLLQICADLAHGFVI